LVEAKPDITLAEVQTALHERTSLRAGLSTIHAALRRIGLRLAEGQELSSNPLRRVFNDLRTTPILVHVDRRILKLLLAVSQSLGQCRFATRRDPELEESRYRSQRGPISSTA
jgi:hypothetical protein